jgi:hypothetical protein
MERYFVVNTTEDEENAKTAWVNVFTETHELPANDANNPKTVK